MWQDPCLLEQLSLVYLLSSASISSIRDPQEQINQQAGKLWHSGRPSPSPELCRCGPSPSPELCRCAQVKDLACTHSPPTGKQTVRKDRAHTTGVTSLLLADLRSNLIQNLSSASEECHSEPENVRLKTPALRFQK